MDDNKKRNELDDKKDDTNNESDKNELDKQNDNTPNNDEKNQDDFDDPKFDMNMFEKLDFDDLNEVSEIIKQIVMTRPVWFQIIPFLLILCALTGLINWISFDNIYFMLISIGSICVFDYICTLIIQGVFKRRLIITFGVIKLIPSLIAFIMVGIFMPHITYTSTFRVVLVYIFYNLLKTPLINLIRRTFSKTYRNTQRFKK